MATYTATVPDTDSGPDRPTHGWLISVQHGGGEGDFFDIDDDGVLTFNDPPDYKDPGDNQYSFGITAYDGNPPSGQDSGKTFINVRVTVIDVEEVNEQPTFADATATRSIIENTAAGENVGDPVSATDPDRDTLEYALGGTDASSFSIDSSTGQLMTDAALDYETKSSYSVTMSVRDSKDDDGNPDTATDDTVDVTITVTNEDEDGTVTLAPPQPQVGTPLTATLSDLDGAVSGTTWVWESSADGTTGWTAASGATSTVTTSSYTPVDADLGRYLRATATYTDPEGSGKSAEAVSGNAVQARPVTNSNPEFPAETTTREVDEDTVAVGNVGAPVTATDTDNGDTLTYGLEGDDAAAFEIDSTSGQIKLATGTTLDYETRNSYQVIVSVRDSKDDYGAADLVTDDSITVTINVTDLNEAPGFPPTETGTRSVDENTAGGQDIGAPVSATDLDTGDTLTYILGGTDASSFDIDSLTGQLLTEAVPDYETKPSYSVTVSVRDSKDADGNPDTATDDTIEVAITVSQRGRRWDDHAVIGPAPDRDGADRHPLRSGWDGKQHNVGMGQFPGRKHRLDRRQRSHQHSNDIELYAGGWRLGQVPAGHRNLHRPGRFRQER